MKMRLITFNIAPIIQRLSKGGISDNEDDVCDSLQLATIDEPGTAKEIETEGRPQISQSEENYNKECHLELNIDEYTSDEDDLPLAQRVICYFGKQTKN